MCVLYMCISIKGYERVCVQCVCELHNLVEGVYLHVVDRSYAVRYWSSPYTKLAINKVQYIHVLAVCVEVSKVCVQCLCELHNPVEGVPTRTLRSYDVPVFSLILS